MHFISGSNAAGEFTVLYSPESIKFSSQTPIQESVLKEVFSASLGLSVEEVRAIIIMPTIM